jgi:hypothetical protein
VIATKGRAVIGGPVPLPVQECKISQARRRGKARKRGQATQFLRQPEGGPFTGTFFLPPFQRNHILVTSRSEQVRAWLADSPVRPGKTWAEPAARTPVTWRTQWR